MHKWHMTLFKKFEEYDIKNIITYHGGLFNDNPNQKIKELLKGNG